MMAPTLNDEDFWNIDLEVCRIFHIIELPLISFYPKKRHNPFLKGTPTATLAVNSQNVCPVTRTPSQEWGWALASTKFITAYRKRLYKDNNINPSGILPTTFWYFLILSCLHLWWWHWCLLASESPFHQIKISAFPSHGKEIMHSICPRNEQKILKIIAK